MPALEEQCNCRCPDCLGGNHCGILDNDCHKPPTVTPFENDTEELWDDEMRASAGFFDSTGLGGSLYPGDEEDDSPEDE